MSAGRPQHTKVDTRPFIDINMRLATLREKTSPAKLVHSLCSAWFDEDARNYLRYIDLPFNVRASPQERQFQKCTETQLLKLGEFVVFLIYLPLCTHIQCQVT